MSNQSIVESGLQGQPLAPDSNALNNSYAAENSGITRRQFLAGLAASTITLPALTHAPAPAPASLGISEEAGEAVTLKPVLDEEGNIRGWAKFTVTPAAAPELTPAAVAWSRVPKKQRIKYYFSQGWKEYEGNSYEVGQVKNLRSELSRLSLYPRLCHDFYPVAASKRAKLEINRRAALHGLIEELGQSDTYSLFEIALLFAQFPLEGEFRDKLIKSQAYHCSECKPAEEKSSPEAEARWLAQVGIPSGEKFLADMRAKLAELTAAAGQGGVA
jgi:hypothetical protein